MNPKRLFGLSTKLFSFILLLMTDLSVMGQTVTINTAKFNTGTYGIGSTITLPISVSGCFNVGNTFQLWMSDANGNFTNAQQIGYYSGFYTNFINGAIGAVPAGSGYKLMVKSTSPALSFAASPSFSITNIVAPASTVVCTANRTLTDASGQTYFGFCSNTASPTLTLTNTSTAGATLSAVLTNMLTGVDSAVNFNGSYLILTLGKSYYTLLVTANSGGVISNNTYYLINSTNNLAVATSGVQKGCIPDSLQFQIITTTSGGIQSNFPGNTYIVNWGDNTFNIYKQCDLISNNGLIDHFYSTTSCKQDSGFFSVNVQLQNPFVGSSIGNCDQPVVNTQARIFRAPTALFNNPANSCVNTVVTFTNTSNPGNGQSTTGCDSAAYYNWIIEDSLGNNLFDTTTPLLSVPPNFNYKFTKEGTYKIYLIVDNGSCQTSSDSSKICINIQPSPSFVSPAAICALDTVKPINNTPPGSCSSMNYTWSVLDTSLNKVPANHYLILYPNVANPAIYFDSSGSYVIQLTASNSCGTSVQNNPINVGGQENVTFKNALQYYCGKIVNIDFSKDTAFMPTYISQKGFSQTYQWSITPPGASFVNSTTSNSQYPVINFPNDTTYTVRVTYTNSCGTSSDSEKISFNGMVTVNAGNDTAICFNTSSIQLHGSYTGSIDSLVWQTLGNGSFNSYQNSSPLYTLGTADKSVDSVLLRLTAYAKKPTACPDVIDTLRVLIYPNNTGNDSVMVVCSGTKLSYIPVSSVPGSTYIWTSQVTTGSTGLSGNQASGSGPVTDNVTNAGIIDDTVIYTITPIANNCTGIPFHFTAIVKPIPNVTAIATSAVICSNQSDSIKLTPAITGTVYNWTANDGAASGVSGFSSGSNYTDSVISQLLYNTSGITVIVNYTITPIGNTGCLGPQQSVNITVNPGPSIANAGPDQKLCNTGQTFLAGNTPVTGTGNWAVIIPPGTSTSINIVSPTVSNSQVTGLHAGDSAFLVWTIGDPATGCPTTSDTVNIIDRPGITPAIAGRDTIICDFNLSQNNSIQLAANATTKSFEKEVWTVLYQPNGGNGIFSGDSLPNSLFSFSKSGVYELQWAISNDAAACAPTEDSIKITVFDKPVSGTITASSSSICYSNNVTFTLNNYTGNISKWQYRIDSSAIWKDIPVTTSTYTFNNALDTFLIRAIVVSNGTVCSSSDTTAPFLVNVSPVSIGGITHSDTTVCAGNNSGTVTLSGFTGSVSNWQYSTDSISWNNIADSGNTYQYNNLTQTTWYRAVIQSGPCSSAFSAASKITVLGAVSLAVAGNDQFFCNQDTALLNGNVPNSGYGLWKQISGSPVVIANAALPATEIRGMQPGNTYTFSWNISNNTCPASSDTIHIYDYPVLTDSIVNVSYAICAGQSVTITGIASTGGNGLYHYQWQQSNDSINWTNLANDTLSNLTIAASDTLFLRRSVSSSCAQLSNTVKVTVQLAINNNSISANQNICTGTPAQPLTGTVPGGGNGLYLYQWQQSLDGGVTWSSITGATGINYIPDTLKQTTLYRRIVSTNLCTGPQSNTSNIITVHVGGNALASFTYLKDTACAPFVLSAVINAKSDTSNTSYEWFANNVLIGNGQAFPSTYIMQQPSDSVTIKLLTLSSCLNDSMQHVFHTILQPVSAFTVSDTSGCGPLAVTFTNTTTYQNQFTYKWDFGNGVVVNAANPGTILFQPSSFSADTVYTVNFITYTPCDSIVLKQNIHVISVPHAIFTPNPTVGCSPLTVRLNNTSKGNSNSYIWQFGDGTSLSTTQDSIVHHTYHSAGLDTFYVKLLAINGCGSDSITYNIVISPNKIFLDFTVNGTNLSACNPDTVRFFNNTSGATSFNWNFGDGNVLTTIKGVDTVTHIYTTPGIFTATLDANNGCSDTTISSTIKVFAKPITAFTAVPSLVCFGDSVHFNNQTDTATNYNWNFGDGIQSSLTSPVHLYTDTGTYTAKLIATRQYNTGTFCTDSAFQTVKMVLKQLGVFTVSDSISNCNPFTVNFTNLSLPSVLTTWDYGDGSKDTGNVVSHTYTLPGTYLVKMDAYDPGGCTFEAFKTIVVKGPSGSFKYQYGNICGSIPVYFQVNAQNADSIEYVFGDGTTLTTQSEIVYHTYYKSGDFIPTVILFSGTTCQLTLQGQDTLKIVQVDIIKPGFTLSLLNNCGNTVASFTDTSRSFYGIKNWQWNFGDGSPLSTTQNPQHTYHATNNWPIQLIVGSNSGCTDTLNVAIPIKVNDVPVAFIQNDSFGCTLHPVTYKAITNSIDSVILYNWTFGNNVIKSGNVVSNIYAVTGVDSVRLIAGTNAGCYDTVYARVPILLSPSVVANPENTVICKGNSVQLNASGAVSYVWTPVNQLSCSSCSNPIASPSSTSTYILTGYTPNGCYNTDSVSISVIQPYKVSVISNDTICIGQSVRLTASSGGATQYTWFPVTGLDNPLSPTPKASPNITTQYRVIASDSMNCFNDTAYITVAVGNYPVVNLGQDKILATGSVLQLNPQVINGPISTWSWNPATDLSCSNCEFPVATVQNNICYAVTATNIYGCSASDTICIKAFCEGSQVFIPNGFTPDGDGINDIFMVRATGIKMVNSFKVFNRWGQVVFEKTNFAPNDPQYGWDGRYKGTAAPVDVYIYTCEVVCDNGLTFVYKGNVALLK